MDAAEFEKVWNERHAQDGQLSGEGAADGSNDDAATATAGEASAAEGEAAYGQAGDGTAAAEATPAAAATAATTDEDDLAHLPDRERAQVRAARYGERQAKREAQRLARENEELRRAQGGKPAAAAEADDDDGEYTPDPVVLEQLAEVDPRAAKELQQLAEIRAENARLKAATAAPARPEPEFVADEPADPVLKGALELAPALNDWRLDPKAQHHWQRAKAIDGYLSGLPEWRVDPALPDDKQQELLAKRFNEAVRLRRAESTPKAPPPSKPTAEDAKKIIEASADEAPLSVTDVRGRTPPAQIPSITKAWKGMTNEQILNSGVLR